MATMASDQPNSVDECYEFTRPRPSKKSEAAIGVPTLRRTNALLIAVDEIASPRVTTASHTTDRVTRTAIRSPPVTLIRTMTVTSDGTIAR